MGSAQYSKKKGRDLQKHARDRICHYFPFLKPEQDIYSRSMGANGEDLMFSPKAREALPISVECKNRAAMAVYEFYNDCKDNAKDYQPILVIKQNNSIPLVVMDLEYYLQIMQQLDRYKKNVGM